MPDHDGETGDVIDRTPDTVVLTTAQENWASWMIDLLIYTVVLNLFDEYVHGVEIDSFTISSADLLEQHRGNQQDPSINLEPAPTRLSTARDSLYKVGSGAGDPHVAQVATTPVDNLNSTRAAVDEQRGVVSLAVVPSSRIRGYPERVYSVYTVGP